MKLEGRIEVTAMLAVQILGGRTTSTEDEMRDATALAGRAVESAWVYWSGPRYPDVKSWMQAHDREPYEYGVSSHWWDGPEAGDPCGREQLPADVWAAILGDKRGHIIEYPTREAAVAALRAALVKLGQIKE